MSVTKFFRGLRVVELRGRQRKPKNNSELLARHAARRIAMNGQQGISGHVLPFSPKGDEKHGPGIGGDTTPVLPLLDSPSAFAEVSSHVSDSVPARKYVENGLHAPDSVGDGLSRQVGTMNSVTDFVDKRTMCPRMGRGTTPTNVKKMIAERLRAARIAAEYPTQAEFAKVLGVEVERYKKWESGRTPIPHEFVALACDLLGKDANYLYGIQAKVAVRKAV